MCRAILGMTTISRPGDISRRLSQYALKQAPTCGHAMFAKQGQSRLHEVLRPSRAEQTVSFFPVRDSFAHRDTLMRLRAGATSLE